MWVKYIIIMSIKCLEWTYFETQATSISVLKIIWSVLLLWTVSPLTRQWMPRLWGSGCEMIYIYFLKQHSLYSFLSFWTLLSVLHNDSSWKCMDIVTKKQNKRSWNKRQWHLPSSNEKQRTNLLYNDAHHHVLLSNIDGVGTNSNIYLKLANYNSCT